MCGARRRDVHESPRYRMTARRMAHARSKSIWRLVSALWLVAATARAAGAQNGLGSERRDVERTVGDIWSVWVSPLHTKGSDLLVVATALGTSAITSGADYA